MIYLGTSLVWRNPKVIAIGDVNDSTVMHVNKGNPLFARESRGNPHGTQGNPVTGIIPNIIYYSSVYDDSVRHSDKLYTGKVKNKAPNNLHSQHENLPGNSRNQMLLFTMLGSGFL